MFQKTLIPVPGHRIPPLDFLLKVLDYCKTAPEEIFAPNSATDDVYARVHGALIGDKPWPDMLSRRAAMAEAMRVHAALESDYNWNEGIDTNNQHSETHITGQETGIFQVSFDSEWLAPSLRRYNNAKGIMTPQQFITAMKASHDLAIDYYARLVRVTTRWAGPYNTGDVARHVSTAAYEEFLDMIHEG